MTTKKPDGGPAFPAPNYLNMGLSLRDYFAAKAMLANELDYLPDHDRARRAYAIADAMLAERGKP